MTLDWLAAASARGDDPLCPIARAQVTELHTILSMVTPLGWLTRLPTFKEKVRQQPDNVNYGLVGYPVLMAATSCCTRPTSCRSAWTRPLTWSSPARSCAASTTPLVKF